jgi:hypothetical protein
MTQFVRAPAVKFGSLTNDCEVSIEISGINWRSEIRRKDETGISP